MLKKILTIIFAGLVLIGVNTMAEAKKVLKENETWDKIFTKSEQVDAKKVYFKNRFGITLAADLYIPKSIKENEKLPAIAIAGPFGAVKEQASGLYAQTLAQKGFITLAFDPSYTGESSGTPRHVASPDINTEDFSAAVDFLSVQNNIDPDKIGILGICGFGGFAINAAAIDTRIKATVASTMYDMTRVSAKGYDDTTDEDARYKMKLGLNKQRTQDFKNLLIGAEYAKAQGLPEKLSEEDPLFIKEYYDFYKTKRGFHPRSINSNGAWNQTSVLSMINQPILQYASEIRTPVLLIHGEIAHSLYFSKGAYEKLTNGNYKDNKELHIVEGANHVDLYDNLEKIPFDKLVQFYKENLK